VTRSVARTGLIIVTALLAASVAVPLPASATAAQGWIRLAHLSPDTPKVDVYLSSFGRDDDPTILRGVGYGTFSDYQRVPAGSYTVAMRGEGAPASDPPVLSTTVEIQADAAATVAGMGRNADIRLVTLIDDLESPGPGRSKVRIIQAAMTAPVVDVVEVAGASVATKLEFTEATTYQAVRAGTATVRVDSEAATAEEPLELRSGGTYTVVVRDLSGGIGVLPIQDSAAARQIPAGGVDAGLGGTAPEPSSRSWILALAAVGLAGLALSRLPRARTR